MTKTKHTPDFTFKETWGASGFNYWIKGVGNLYPDDKCTDEKLALIAAAPLLLSELIDATDSLEQLASGEWEPDEGEFAKVLARYKAVINRATGKE